MTHSNQFEFKSPADAHAVAVRPTSARERISALKYLASREDARHTGFVAAQTILDSEPEHIDAQTKELLIQLLSRGLEKQLSELKGNFSDRTAPFDEIDLIKASALSSRPEVIAEWLAQIRDKQITVRRSSIQLLLNAKKGTCTPEQSAEITDYLLTKYVVDESGEDSPSPEHLSTIKSFLATHGCDAVWLRSVQHVKSDGNDAIAVAVWDVLVRNAGASFADTSLEIFATNPLRFVIALDDSTPKNFAADCRHVLREVVSIPETDPDSVATLVSVFTQWFPNLPRSEKMTTTETFSFLLDRVAKSQKLGRALADFFVVAPDGKSITSKASQILFPPPAPSQGFWGTLTGTLGLSKNVALPLVASPEVASVEFAVRMLENFTEPGRESAYEIALSTRNTDGRAWLSPECAVIVALALGPQSPTARKVIQAVDAETIVDWDDEQFDRYVVFAAGMTIDTSLPQIVHATILTDPALVDRLTSIYQEYFVVQWAASSGNPSLQKPIIRALFELVDRCGDSQEIADCIIVPFYRQMRTAPYEVRTLLRARYDAKKNVENDLPVEKAEWGEIIRLLSEGKVAQAL